jgi:LysM repeat protein
MGIAYLKNKLKRMKNIILVIIFITFGVTGFSQEKKYTTYRVKANETLTSIAKKIGVTTFELEKLNPDAKDGIHIDEVLIIPNSKYKNKGFSKRIFSYKKKVVEQSKNTKVFKDSIKDGILYHKVRPGETVFSLSQKYKVKKKKILKLNHLKKRGKIKVGQILKIPTDKPNTHYSKPHLVINDSKNSKYKKYIVQSGETKYSLARSNNIDVSKLEKINPFLKENILKEGDQILLPKSIQETQNDSNESGNTNKLYTVTEEDTFFNFEHNSGFTKDELIELNPELKEGLKVGMIIKLPNKSNDLAKEKSYITHQIGYQETFYMLGNKYNVTKEELIELNPELKEGLKEGMTIKIPISNNISDIEMNEMNEGDVSGKEVNIVMLLPFKADKNVDFSDDSKETKFANKVTDFYFGGLMALDSLKSMGININLKVLDTKNDALEVKHILNSTDFSKTDLVIGPLVYSKFKTFATNFINDSIPLISPVSKKNHSMIFKSNVVQNSPKIEDIENVMLQFIRDNYNNQNIVIVADEGKEIDTKIERVKQFLKLNDSIKKISVLKMEENQIKREEFDKNVIEDIENWFILVTNPKKPTTTSVVVNSLGAYSPEYKIKLFALERGKNFIDAELANKNLNRLNVHFPVITFADKNDYTIMNFNNKYVKKFGSIPTEFSYKGFDTMYDAVIRFANYHKIDSMYNAGNSYRIADKYKYQKVPFQGYYNKGVHIVEMKDFQLIKAKPNKKSFVSLTEDNLDNKKKK